MSETLTPLVIMVAPNGARRTKDDHPGLPLLPEEIAAEAKLAAEAGATILHLHVRDGAGGHSLEPAHYRPAIEAVRAAVGDAMAIQVTTEAVGRYDAARQMAIVRELRPEAVSLAIKELCPDAAATDQAASFFAWLRDEGIAPQFIFYTPGEVARFAALREEGVIPQKDPFALFVLGRYTAPGDVVRTTDLLPFLAGHDLLTPWAICAFGQVESSASLVAAGLGGHVRVGFENNLRTADGSLAPNNAALVAQIRDAAPLLCREVADIRTTRTLLRRTAA
jgi:uncharacterized protein (DUF849 family)